MCRGMSETPDQSDPIFQYGAGSLQFYRQGTGHYESLYTGCWLVLAGICVKNCQHDAVKVENFHAVIDPEKCVGCGAAWKNALKSVL